MTLSETLALYDDGHTFIAQNIDCYSLLSIRKKTKQKPKKKKA